MLFVQPSNIEKLKWAGDWHQVVLRLRLPSELLLLCVSSPHQRRPPQVWEHKRASVRRCTPSRAGSVWRDPTDGSEGNGTENRKDSQHLQSSDTEGIKGIKASIVPLIHWDGCCGLQTGAAITGFASLSHLCRAHTNTRTC